MLFAIVAALLTSSGEAKSPRVMVQCPTLASPNVAVLTPRLTTRYGNADGFSMHRERGSSTCTGDEATHRCIVKDPGLMRVTFSGEARWFDIPRGREVVLDVRDRELRCGLAD